MIIATMLSGLATLFWLSLIGYVAWVFVERSRHRDRKLRISVIVGILVLALLSSALASSIVVIDAGEVGVVFNAFIGTKETPLYPGMHLIIPYVEAVYRYSTQEQVYTMTTNPGTEQVATGAMQDDSLWSPTREGLQVGIDSSTRYAIDPRQAPHVHNSFRNTYVEVLIRPTIRSIVRHYVSQNTVTDIYGPKRREIQIAIENDIRERFEKEGFLLLSFDIRNVNFTTDYAQSIEQKQIAQQQAEQMQYVLQREQQEAERKRVEAEGIKDAAITQAEGEAEALRLISDALAKNPNLLTYRYIEKLSPNIRVIILPSGTPFILSPEQLIGETSESGK
ncbi:MAG: SPFH domain-containing protein [Anaerolineae bacterium]|jgi:regulator of protease activity HflC (stomatin/prohibitin superfamily)|nr:SPFH domain-containing protein [Anaerolineae bacterium]MDH7475638.1 SPFH domain-containing protein [Anaerolineae bacterium]